jgi:hypothetical protein
MGPDTPESHNSLSNFCRLAKHLYGGAGTVNYASHSQPPRCRGQQREEACQLARLGLGLPVELFGLYVHHLDGANLLQPGDLTVRCHLSTVPKGDLSVLRILAGIEPLLQAPGLQDCRSGSFR